MITWTGDAQRALNCGAIMTKNCASLLIRFWIWPVDSFWMPASRRHLKKRE